MKKTIKVKGMHCGSCEVLLKEAIEENGIHVHSASTPKGEVVVELKDEKEMAAVKKAIEKEGYHIA
jgi:copper chaperone CopZ